MAKKSADKKESSALSLTKGMADVAALEMREIPQAPGPERGVLSLMATDPATYIGQAIAMGMKEEFFYLPAHRILWNLFVKRFNNNEPLDIVSISQALSDANKLEAIGGAAGLADIYTYTTIGGYFEHYVQLLKDKYTLRSMIDISTESMTQAFNNPEDVTKLLDTFETKIFQIREQYAKQGKDDENLQALIEAALNNFEQYISTRGQVQFLPTGYEELDKKCNGLKPGEMFVIAARPSVGKTALLLNIIEHIVLDSHKPALLFSCEMPAVQIVDRMLFSRAGVRRREIITRGTITQLEMQHVQKATLELKNAPLIIDDTAGISIAELRAKARRVVREIGNLGVIGIDYLQLMRSYSQQAANSREREVAEISAGLKALAKELKVPVVVLAQLNRSSETRTGASRGVPLMSDLRESGSIEQDADMIGLLYREGYSATDEKEREEKMKEGRAALLLAKNRNGATGNVPLHFDGELMRFTTREPDRDEDEA